VVYYLREAILDIIFVGKDDNTVKGSIAPNSFLCGGGNLETNGTMETGASINDGESTIHTKEQNNRLASGFGTSPPADDNTFTSTIVTEKSLNTNESGSDSSYELV